ncbi:DUF2939 domain-containing protein [Janthinobacterium sp.]|uniref:DUF2939 domain-containing protein n=1 Tax=Janthinobacterium sp. TaxID=1871054 RepID=UPI00293D2251|nr:DUF2939 domain-containing protein [Janthinobacterium sp.]
MTSRSIKAATVVAVVGIAAYWYWSPFLAVRQMRSAAREGNAGAFNEHVDYPKVRESIKGQFSSMFEQKSALPADPHNRLAQAGAAFGARLGMVMVNQFVDGMVRPETVMRAMEYGQFPDKSAPPGAAAPQDGAAADGQADAAPDQSKPKWRYERKGVNKVVAYSTAEEGQGRGKFAFVLQRQGFADWKLTEVLLQDSIR